MSTTNDHSQRGHHPQGPSQLKPLKDCPGFENLPGTSAAAEMGTRIHEALEVRDPNGLESELEIQMYHQCILKEDQLIAEFFNGEEYERFNELPVTIPLNSGYEIWGTGDVLCVAKSGRRALMIDYKTGRMQVADAKDNLQAKAYKNGTFASFPKLESLRFIFLAPQINWIDWHDFAVETVDLDRQEITQIVANAKRVAEDWAQGRVDPDDLRACEQCTFCRHQTYCPKVNGLLIDFAKQAGMSVPTTLDLNNLEDPDQVAVMYGIAKVVEPLLDRIKAAAVTLSKDGEYLPGWELRSMGASWVSGDNKGLFEYLLQYGITLEDVLDTVNLPVAQFRDLVKERAPKGAKGKVAKAFEEDALDKGVIYKGKERFTLKPTSSDE